MAESASSQVTTYATSGQVLDQGASPSVTFGATDTAVGVLVPESGSISQPTTSYQLDMEPSLLRSRAIANTLTVYSNAGQGWTLTLGVANGGSGGAPTAGTYAGLGVAQTLVKTTGPSGDTGAAVSMTHDFAISYATAAGPYQDTMTYTLTPSF